LTNPKTPPKTNNFTQAVAQLPPRRNPHPVHRRTRENRRADPAAHP